MQTEPNPNPTSNTYSPIAHLTPYPLSPPSTFTHYLISRNISSLLQHIYSQTRFNNTISLKTKALQQLKSVVLLSGKGITKYVQELLKRLAGLYEQQRESEENRRLVLEVSEVLGWVGEWEGVFGITWQILRVETGEERERERGTRQTANLLLILSKLILHKTYQQLSPHRNKLLSLLSLPSSQSPQLLLSLLSLLQTLLLKLPQILQQQTPIFFHLLLTIQSTRSLSPQTRTRALSSLTQLSWRSGFTSTSQLYSHLVEPVLDRWITKKEYLKWGRTSRERFEFDTLVRNSKQVIPKYIDQIFEILRGMVSRENDLEVRMDALVLIQYILNIEPIKQDLKQHSITLMKSILIPAIRWKVGSPETKIRKAGILNMVTLINLEIIDAKGMVDCVGELLPPLKDCLADDREPDLRLVSLTLLQSLLLLSSPLLPQDPLRDIYVSLLQRLDDSKNQLRIQTTKCINAFLLCPAIRSMPTIFEYLVQGVMVHFDAEYEELRERVLVSLKHAANVDARRVGEWARKAVGRMRHTAVGKELMEYCEERMEDEEQREREGKQKE